MTNRIIPIFIPHLGCPHRCVFCQQNRITGWEKPPTPETVFEIIGQGLTRAACSGTGPIEVAFYGGNFTALPAGLMRKYLEAVEPYLRQGRVASVRVSTRPDAINPEVLSVLAEHGVRTVELGVQSLDPEVLAGAERGYTPEQVWEAARLIKGRGLTLGVQLMVGLPHDTCEKDIATARAVIDMRPAMVRIYPTLVFEGTRLHQMWKEGLYRPLSLTEAVDITADMFIVLEAEDIAVIRMGLQPTDECHAGGAVAAGPFHPSFGELVESEVFYRQVMTAFNFWREILDAGDWVVFVNKKDLSKIIGQNGGNRERLRKSLGAEKLRIRGIVSEKTGWVGFGKDSSESPDLILSRQEFCRLWSGGVMPCERPDTF